MLERLKYGLTLLGKTVRRYPHLTPMSPSPALAKSIDAWGMVQLACPHCAQPVGTYAADVLEEWPPGQPSQTDGEVDGG